MFWKEIKDYPNYQINELGKIFNLSRKTYLKPTVNKQGYVSVGLSNNGKFKTYLLHRLVAQSFIQNLDNKPVVNHKDSNKLNNHKDNLEWSSYSENNYHSVIKNNKRGSNIHSSKLTEEDVLNIKKALTKGESISRLGLKYGVCKQTVFKIKTNKIWKHIKEINND